MVTVQAQFLNYILKTKDFSIIVSRNLDKSYFFLYENEFNYIKKHFDSYGVVPDQLTFLQVFPDFPITDVTEPLSYLLEKLSEEQFYSYIGEQFNKMKGLVENRKYNEAREFLTKIGEGVREDASLTSTDLFEDFSRYDHYVDRATGKATPYHKTGFKELDEDVGGVDPENENMVIAARTGIGKCLAKGTHVLMADGTTKAVEDVRVGDVVQSYNRTNTVLGLHNGVSNGYRIVPTKGEPFIVSSNHILTLYKYNEVYDKDTRSMKVSGGQLVDIMIEDFLSLNKHQQHLYKLFRPAVSYDKKAQSIDPYILGVWLGDGTSKYGQICTADSEILEAIKEYAAKVNQEVHELASSGGGPLRLYSITGGFHTELKRLNLLNNKHIPLNYLTGDREQRLALLAGLLDTDGYYSNKYHFFDFTQKSEQLFKQVLQLARGLGFRVTVQKPKCVKGTLYHRCTLSGDLYEIPTKIKRKRAPKTTHMVSFSNFGFKVEPVDVVEYYGFMCDGDSRYLLWDNTLTHNTWLLVALAASFLKQGLRVGLYSGEMSKDKVGYRLDTMLAGIDNRAIMRGDPMAMNIYHNYVEKSRGKYHFFCLTPNDVASGQPTVPDIKAFAVNNRVDVLLIDQYSLVTDVNRAKTTWEAVSNISKDIKNMQVNLGIPIISVAQMNRTKNEDENGKKVQDTTQIGLSDRIAQDATIVLMLDRDKETNTLTINVVKARDGGDGRKLTYQADFNKGTFTYINLEPDAAAAKALQESYSKPIDEVEDVQSSVSSFGGGGMLPWES